MIPLLPLATGLFGTLVGGAVMYVAARFRFKTKLAAMRRETGMNAYTNGVAMGLRVQPSFVRDGKLEHWDADAETCLKSLILPSRFSEETS